MAEQNPNYAPITPTRQDIDAWRQHCDWAEEFEWILPGEFNWVRAVRSLIVVWENQHDR